MEKSVNKFKFLILYTVIISCSTLAREGTIKLVKLPEFVNSDLLEYVSQYNLHLEPIDEFSPYDPRIRYVPKDGYFYNGKYLIPIVESGSNYAFTIFLLWDGVIKKRIQLDGYAYSFIQQIENYPLLKIYYNAGCCNARYLSVGILSLFNQTLTNLFVLPKFVQNTFDRSDGAEFNGDIYFRLVSDISIKLTSEQNDFSIRQDYWLVANPKMHKKFSDLKIPTQKPTFSINMIYNSEIDNVRLRKERNCTDSLLRTIGFPQAKLNAILLMQKFVLWLEEKYIN